MTVSTQTVLQFGLNEIILRVFRAAHNHLSPEETGKEDVEITGFAILSPNAVRQHHRSHVLPLSVIVGMEINDLHRTNIMLAIEYSDGRHGGVVFAILES